MLEAKVYWWMFHEQMNIWMFQHLFMSWCIAYNIICSNIMPINIKQNQQENWLLIDMLQNWYILIEQSIIAAEAVRCSGVMTI